MAEVTWNFEELSVTPDPAPMVGETPSEELVRLREELKQTRLDLINSDAIREALVTQSIDVARDMARALDKVEQAYHAGFRAGRAPGGTTPDAAYRRWLAEIKSS